MEKTEAAIKIHRVGIIIVTLDKKIISGVSSDPNKARFNEKSFN